MSFGDRMDEIVNQGLEFSRELLGKAKEKARELGEKGLLCYEIAQIGQARRRRSSASWMRRFTRSW